MYARWYQDLGSNPVYAAAVVTNGSDSLDGSVALNGGTPIITLSGTFSATIDGISGAVAIDDLVGEVVNRPPTAVISNIPSSVESDEDPYNQGS